MNMRLAAKAALAAAALIWGGPAARAQITVNLAPGNFNYQFADPSTGLPETAVSMTGVGQTVKVAVYLVQTGGTPANLLTQLGAEGLGVRLNYTGGAAQVPTTGAANIVARPPTPAQVGLQLSDFTVVQRYGSATGTDTTSSAAIAEGLQSSLDALPFPGDASEDPLGLGTRMLIGTFTFKSLAGGVETVTAVSGPSSGVNSLTGPNPQLTSASRNDGTSGPVPGNGNQGEVRLDQYLAQNINPALEPILTISVVPEPGTLALGSMAVVGLSAWRRRRTKLGSL